MIMRLNIIIVQKLNDESMIRQMILNSIRMYNKRYRDEYGQMVICADGMNTWRKDYYPTIKLSVEKIEMLPTKIGMRFLEFYI